ncbi:endonuclease/exonuclease/phosphatase family protein [Flavobacterium subsaxonicum]|uniref:Endonuclease n=1 Tax=Flavobacterium subsaxonicum WB 4.1-42 = DSM 21790 TaxID=1121898 RepID=A0A0A2MN95_9FLAO|nr:endonuclease/exonuclease/phosphatase family protein [Flavobacterium subsaxonicum]KGO92948.1 endonuclease [Flavobacterium subsaxonicum WB 4.1-42 = DSM 21790]
MIIFTTLLAILLLIFTLLPLIKNDYWVFRVFDYPRLQKFTMSCVSFFLLINYFKRDDILHWCLTIAIGANIIYLAYLIAPFTVFGKKQVLRVTKHVADQSVSLMIANVFEDNTNYKGCLAEINKANPDIVLLLETSHRWDNETAELSTKYPFSVKVPIDNTYGMLLYSKLELADSEIKFLVEKDIPSIHTKVLLKNGQQVQLYAVHPTPPVPNENPRSTERDKELLLVADLAKDNSLPVIVIGDLNDVAWSYTTELFLKMSGLLDPRRGRGFFNSFHAHYPIMRFPLDHAFISTDFKLKEMRRLNNFDSDHFPIYINLQYEAKAVHEQESMEADADDIELAEEKKAKI